MSWTSVHGVHKFIIYASELLRGRVFEASLKVSSISVTITHIKH